MVHYTCLRAMLPVVEATLAAHGYVLEHPLQKEVNGDRLIVMTHTSAVVLLSELAQSDLADIEVYGAAQSDTSALLERLPLGLVKQQLKHRATYMAN